MQKAIIIFFLSSLYAGSADHSSVHFTLFNIIPFIGILLSIAVIPLINHHFWEKHYGKISLFWAIAFIIPFYYQATSSSEVAYELLHVMLLEYVPFIILLLSLFTVAGGICLRGTIIGTPRMNLLLLSTGTVLASWMGTTGAAMLLIRPLIRANKWRLNKVHIMVFFIFLVANIGGALTPLGDPPLFLGFLHGVSFFWTTKYLFFPMIFVSSILLVLFFFIDNYFYKKETKIPDEKNNIANIQILGKINFILLLFVVLSVLLSGFWNPHIYYTIMGVHLELQNILRDIFLLFITLISIKMTKENIRKENGFTWFPIMEVAKLFAGIFITIIPAIAILKTGKSGSLGFIVDLLNDESGKSIDLMYFWLTGMLSAFLDNAPTYLVFFNTAGGDASVLMTKMKSTLIAISTGAVFMGAMTYIGNAPNFMVRAIAEENGIKMPSFFGYMAWSFIILGLTFILYSIIFLL
jgi:Na+/H+ antiporter NhaD/arsenite permease-like protein